MEGTLHRTSSGVGGRYAGDLGGSRWDMKVNIQGEGSSIRFFGRDHNGDTEAERYIGTANLNFVSL